jgi:hypothetical protein
MITSSRRGAAAVIGWLLVLAWIWCSADTASAGGPTSVIMVNPGTGQAAALHTSDARYNHLVEAVRAYYPPAGSTTRPASVTDCSGCEIRLTWLIHDMQIWRIDRVHLTSGDGIWLETVADESGGDVLARPAVWHRPSDPETLVGLLTATAVTTTSPRDDIPGSADRSELATTAGRPTPLVGLIAGAGVGLVAGLAVGWLAWHRRPDRDRAVLTG